MWGSMTVTWTQALGFLSLPEATRSLQAKEKEEGREQKMREQDTKGDPAAREDTNQDEAVDNNFPQELGARVYI